MLLKSDDVFKNTVFVAKSVKIVEKFTTPKQCDHAEYVGIKNRAQTKIATTLYKSNFQKTEKFATNNLSEFLNIINKSPY